MSDKSVNSPRYLLCYEISFAGMHGYIAGSAFATFDHGMTQPALEAIAKNLIDEAPKDGAAPKLGKLIWRSVTRLEEPV